MTTTTTTTKTTTMKMKRKKKNEIVNRGQAVLGNQGRRMIIVRAHTSHASIRVVKRLLHER